MEYDVSKCIYDLERHGFTKVDGYSPNPDLTITTYKKEIHEEKMYIIAYTGKEAGAKGVALNCEFDSGNNTVNVASTFNNPFSMYCRVPFGVFMGIVCEHPAKEWIELFHACDVNKTLEVLDGA